MKVFVARAAEGDSGAPRWRKQVTLPKGWLASPAERLTQFVTKSYNQAHSADEPLEAEEWHLANEELDEPLGSKDIISEVVLSRDTLVLRAGAARPTPPPQASAATTGWRFHGSERLRQRAQAAASQEAAIASVLVNVEKEALEALRASIDADDCAAFKEAVERANLGSPHEVPMAEVELRDSLGNNLGTEWHSLGGCFGWDRAEGGPGEAPEKKLSAAQYAQHKGARSVLALVEVADRCGVRISGEGEEHGGRTVEQIEASARSVQGMVSEMRGQAAEQQAAVARHEGATKLEG